MSHFLAETEKRIKKTFFFTFLGYIYSQVSAFPPSFRITLVFFFQNSSTNLINDTELRYLSLFIILINHNL